MVVGHAPARGCPAAARPAPARAAPGRGGRAPRRPRRRAAPARSSVSCSGRESTRCSSRSCRARIRASSRPTWPTPKIATAGTTGSGSSSTVTSPPQHWTPCWTGALSDSCAVNELGGGRHSASSARARSYGHRLEVAAADRAPGRVGADHHLGAGVARRVPAHVGHRHQHARLAVGPQRAHRLASQVVDAVSRRTRVGPAAPGGPRVDAQYTASGVAGEASSTLVPAGPNAAHACAQRLAHARTPASAAARRPPWSRRPRRPRGRSSSVDVEARRISEKLGSL